MTASNASRAATGTPSPLPSGSEPSAANPYLITGPALISFSGGRTSAYMLYQILQAHGGTLPADVIVAFANTGKEREETLRFVEECAFHFGVFIHWVEFVAATGPHHDRFEQVNFHTASRHGEPFERLIALRGRLPNALQRFCSREMKVEPIKALCQSLGWERWTNVIGLRHDEGHRALKKYAENAKGGHRWKSALPLDKARVTKRDVMAFWATRNFDLGLKPHEGNCDLCFLKSRGKLQAIVRDKPDLAGWWITQEATGSRFERDRSYAEIAREVGAQPLLSFDDDEHDAECGLWCAPDQAVA